MKNQNNLKSVLQELGRKEFEKGLRAGKMGQKDLITAAEKRGFEKGSAFAFRSFVEMAKNKCNVETEANADLLPGLVILPVKGFRTIPERLMSLLDEFLELRYNSVEFGRVNATDLYNDYKEFLKEKGIDSFPTDDAFGRDISTKLFKSKQNGRIMYHGITRKAEQHEKTKGERISAAS